ncbi:MAG TPA: hypothetical protein HPP75_09790 [Rhodospirillaceae bacterium]|nr:hypothetical protein [Rhodospirillaceae bacterium]
MLLGEHEAGAKGMRRRQQATYVHGLADALDADAEVAAHGVLLSANRLDRCLSIASLKSAELARRASERLSKIPWTH